MSDCGSKCQNCNGNPIGSNGSVCDVCDGLGTDCISCGLVFDYPIVLVCGGRDNYDSASVSKVLNSISNKVGKIIIMSGAATGIDSIAIDWAKRREFAFIGVPAEWTEHRFGAGPRRNKRMAYVFKPTIVVAFRGGDGTNNMVELARSNDIPVLDYRYL